MARQIVIQPNGLIAIWSTIVDDFIEKDLSPSQYITFQIKEAIEYAYEEAERDIARIKNNDLRYTKSYEECMEAIKKKGIIAI